MKKTFLLFKLAILSLGLNVCSFAADTSTQKLPPPADNKSYTLYQPNPKDLPKIFKKFEDFAIKTQQELKVPGFAMVVIQNDKIIYAKGFGVKRADQPANDPANQINTHTIFEIGSMSKSFTAALVAMAIDEKKFSWDTRVIDLYPDFRMYDPWVTKEFRVKDLMAQHSGLAPYSGDFLALVGFDRNYLIHNIRNLKPIDSFRAAYAYQNHLFLVANALLEKYSKKTWNQNISERIFKPLGMTESTTTSREFRQTPNVAYLHVMKQGKVMTVPMNWLEDFNWIDIIAPAGGINSNVLDLTKWLRLQLNNGNFEGKQLISVQNLGATHAPQTLMGIDDTGQFLYYSMGWVFDTQHAYPILWHTGGTTGASTIMGISPATKTGVIILTNLGDSNLDLILMKTFFDLYFNHPGKDWKRDVLGKEQKAKKETVKFELPPTSPTPALPLEKYAGTYQSDVYGTINIAIVNGQLETILGPGKARLVFKHWDRDSFEVIWVGKEPGYFLSESKKMLATFIVDPAGEVKALTIDALDQADNVEPFKKV